MSMVDSRGFQAPRNVIQRKPLPPAPTSVPPAMQSRPNYQPDQTYLPQNQQQQQQQPPQQYAHSRSRTASSSIFPLTSAAGPQQQQPPPQQLPPQQQQQQQLYQNENRMPGQGQGQATQHFSRPIRTASTATDSTSSSNYESQESFSNNGPMRQNSGASSSLQRSGSSHSGSSASSYVAMMRKQKATVWSDRAQYEDPRLKNQQRLAKIHARAEMSGAASIAGGRVSSGSSSLTGGVRSKIRHHGAPKAQQFPGALSAGGVPIRLSQNEIDEDDSEEGSQPGTTLHQRTDSGRSSLGSAGRTANAYSLHGQSAPLGAAAPANTQASPEPKGEGLGSAEETPVPDHFRGQDYFDGKQQQQTTNPTLARAGSGGSGSTDRENSFGQAGTLPQRVQAENNDDTLDPAELRRRGSVDERTMTMSGYGKLFVANPDVDD